MIRFNCPECGKAYSVEDKFAGKRANCTHCGVKNIVVPKLDSDSNVKPTVTPKEDEPSCKSGGSKIIIIEAALFIVAGMIVTVSAYLMETTVSAAEGRIHNIGLMHRRQTQLILGLAFFSFGLAIAIADHFNSRRRNGDPQCATIISMADEIVKLKALMDQGVITKQDFEIGKRRLLDS